MSEKFYANILKGGVYLGLLSVFFVFRNLLFPYISSKQIYFNILIEVLAIFWVVYLVKFPKARPKGNWMSWGLLAYFAVILISSFTGVDWRLSVWGDTERMLGFFHIFHFLIYYFIIITVMKTEKDWKIFFNLSVMASMFVVFYALNDSDQAVKGWSTIGNTAYVSAYIIFNLFFSIFLFYKNRVWPIKVLYLLAVLLLLVQFKATNTSGAYVGLAAGIFVALLLYIFLSKQKKLKIATASILIVLTSVVLLIFTNKQSNFVQSKPYLKKITNAISFKKNTFQTRLVSWRGALQDFKYHPFLGVGHGNYAYVFDKHFTPDFYNYTTSETYFDRAHNNVIDIVSTVGLIGLAAYLSIFGATAFYLSSGYKKNKINIHELVIISSLLVAYFVQNLAVFDSLVTYLSLMITLGYIYWMYNREAGEEEIKVSYDVFDWSLLSGLFVLLMLVLAGDKINYFRKDNLRILGMVFSFYLVYILFVYWKTKREGKWSTKEIISLTFVGVLLSSVIYQYNILPLKMMSGTIESQMVFNQAKDLVRAYDVQKKALDMNTIMDRDSRTTFIRMVGSAADMLPKLEGEKASEILDYAIALAEKNVSYFPGDSLNQLLLAQTLNTAALFYRGNTDKFNFYSDRAMEAINRSIDASPGRTTIYFSKSQIYLTRNEMDKAIEVMQFAYDMNPKYSDSVCQLSRTYMYLGQEDKSYEFMDKCIDLKGLDIIGPVDYIKTLINHYAKGDNWDRMITLYVRLSKLEPTNTKVWVSLAKLYEKIGNNEKAITAATKAAELDPKLKTSVDEYIKRLQN